MLAVFAKFERDILRERVKAGIAQRERKEGLTGSRQRPEEKTRLSGRWLRMVPSQAHRQATWNQPDIGAKNLG